MALPDYHGGSIVNLMASIVTACGGCGSFYGPLRSLAPSDLSGARNIILMVIDGLGLHYLTQQGRSGALKEHLKGPMTSVFPPTTASAITAFHTGLAPQQHGLTGWFTYFREVGSVVSVLPFRARHGGGSLKDAGVDPKRVFVGEPVFDAIAVPSVVVSHKSILESDYNLYHSGGAARRGYDNLKHFFHEIELAAKTMGARQYIYAYYPELDALSHTFGVASPQVAALFARIDAMFGEFLGAIAGTDSMVIVTADHGFVDIEPGHTIELENHPELADTLVLPLCGERRVAYCYVHPDKRERFEAYARGPLAQYAELHRSEELVKQGWFGLGTPHPHLLDRIGHYTLVMKDKYGIKDWVLGERRHVHIGAHGGVSDDEMHVPLIIARA